MKLISKSATATARLAAKRFSATPTTTSTTTTTAAGASSRSKPINATGSEQLHSSPKQLQTPQQSKDCGKQERTIPSRNGMTLMETTMQRTLKPSPRTNRDVCQRHAPRNSNIKRTASLCSRVCSSTYRSMRSVRRRKPGRKWRHVRTHGGRDLQTADYVLCLRRYVALNEEFIRQEAKSGTSRLKETMTRQDELLKDLAQKEADIIDEQRQQREQCTENAFWAQNIEEWHGYINREESLLLMGTPVVFPAASPLSVDPSVSPSAPSSSSSSNHGASSTNRLIASVSMRFNSLRRRTQRTRAPRLSTVEKRTLELMENINELVSEIRQKI